MTAESFLKGRVTLHSGDSRDVLRSLPDASIDSIVTDPPYALVSIGKRFGKAGSSEAIVPEGKSGAYARASAGFMGKQWDTGETAFAVEFWEQCLRVLKPGGHVVAFSGTRSYHRLACAIEDAGFEIRDSIFWHYGSGFPKSHNISKVLDAKKERCSCPVHLRRLRPDLAAGDTVSGRQEQDVLSGVQVGLDCEDGSGQALAVQSSRDDILRGLRDEEGNAASVVTPGSPANLQPAVQRRASRSGVEASRSEGLQSPHTRILCQGGDEGAGECCLEGGRDASQAPGQLCERPICPLPAGSDQHGASGRLCDGASAGDGASDQAAAAAGGMRAPSGSRAAEQRRDQSGAVAGQPQPQNGGAWPYCGRCGKPIVSDGLGTALKPATEPICLARKPLAGTVAANVLAHGTGALNIDGCRVGDEVRHAAFTSLAPCSGNRLGDASTTAARRGTQGEPKQYTGRWPANIIHDGSDEVANAFPQSNGQQGVVSGNEPSSPFANVYGDMPLRTGRAEPRGDTGSAARFFYSAKADADDRIGSKHPTVKPVDLMQWLCRLVTPPGGTVLDPFAGSGTTGEAAWREGFRAVLCEREAEYQADIARRMALCLAGPDERKRESIKAKTKDQPTDAGPLFGGSMESGGVRPPDLREVRRSGRTIGPIGMRR